MNYYVILGDVEGEYKHEDPFHVFDLSGSFAGNR